MQIENDELAGEGEQCDEEHDLRLDDALLSRDDVLEGVVELEGDQERHDLPEQRLKHPLIQGVEGTEQQPGDHADGQAVQRNQDDQSDDQRQDEGNRALETLVVRTDGPFRFQTLPSGQCSHGASAEPSCRAFQRSLGMLMPRPLRHRRVRIAGARTGRTSACEVSSRRTSPRYSARRHVPPAPVRRTISRSRPVGNACGVGWPARRCAIGLPGGSRGSCG